MMCLLASYGKRKKYESCERKKSDLELDPDPKPDPDPLVRGTDPGIRILTKMSRIPNTGTRKPRVRYVFFYKCSGSKTLWVGNGKASWAMRFICQKKWHRYEYLCATVTNE